MIGSDILRNASVKIKTDWSYYGWKIVLACFFTMFLAFTINGSLAGIFVIPVTKDLGITRGQFMLYATVTNIIGMIFAPFAGQMLSKKDLPKIMIFAAFLDGLSYIGFALAKNITSIYIFAAIIGISGPCLTILPLSILITSWFNSKRGFAMGLAMTGSSLGAFVLSPLSNILINNFGWRFAYVVLGLSIIIILSPLIFFIIKKTPKDKGLVPYTEALPNGSMAGAGKAGLSIEGYTLKQISLSPSFIFYLLASFLLFFITTCGAATTVPYLISLGIDGTKAAGIFGLSMGFLAVGKILLGYLFDKIKLITTIAIGIICFILSVLCLIYAKNPIFIAGFIAFYILGGSLSTVAPSYATAQLYGIKEYGKIYGIVSMITRFGSAIGFPVSSIIFDKTGSYSFTFTIMIVSSIATMTFYFLSIMLKSKVKTLEENNALNT